MAFSNGDFARVVLAMACRHHFRAQPVSQASTLAIRSLALGDVCQDCGAAREMLPVRPLYHAGALGFVRVSLWVDVLEYVGPHGSLWRHRAIALTVSGVGHADGVAAAVALRRLDLSRDFVAHLSPLVDVPTGDLFHGASLISGIYVWSTSILRFYAVARALLQPNPPPRDSHSDSTIVFGTTRSPLVGVVGLR